MNEILTKSAGSWRIILWAILALPLLAAAIAMAMGVEGVHWTAFDFFVAAILLGGTGAGLQMLLGAGRSRPYRLASLLGLGGLLMLVWSNLAVGIVGSEQDPFNLFYFLAVPIIGLGSALSRLKPEGLSRTMAAVAALCGAMMVAAFALGKHLQPRDSIQEVVIVNAIFIALFGLSALFFRQAARG